jgi:hypothetical protein
LEQLLRREFEQGKQRAIENAVSAWKTLDPGLLFNALAEYYEERGVTPFAYPGTAQRVPLFVRPEWLHLDERSLVMVYDGVERPVERDKASQRFFDLFSSNAFRKGVGLDPIGDDGEIFRLVRLESSEHQLKLHFEKGSFFDTVASQFVLEHETRLAVGTVSTKLRSGDAPIRDRVASTPGAIERFCETRPARVGVSNLLLFRRDHGSYVAAIRKRGSRSMGSVGKFDCISSGIFNIFSADAAADCNCRRKVLEEVYEELFGGTDVENEGRGFDPYAYLRKPPMKALTGLLDSGRAFLRVTGFCVDLACLVPEVTTVLVVRDPSYHDEWQEQMVLNREYGKGKRGVPITIPVNISNVDRYLADEFPSDPAVETGPKGFDPSKWTRTGAFCFYQGLTRAVADSLL